MLRIMLLARLQFQLHNRFSREIIFACLCFPWCQSINYHYIGFTDLWLFLQELRMNFFLVNLGGGPDLADVLLPLHRTTTPPCAFARDVLSPMARSPGVPNQFLSSIPSSWSTGSGARLCGAYIYIYIYHHIRNSPLFFFGV